MTERQTRSQQWRAQPWAENVEPTAEQLLAWLLTLPPSEQLDVVGRLRRDAGAAARCFIENHAGAVAELPRISGELARATARLRHIDRVADYFDEQGAPWSALAPTLRHDPARERTSA